MLIRDVPSDLSHGVHFDSGWAASLAMGFERRSDARTVVRHQHRGPLRIQKALYPEGRERCHVVIVHPPGGVASGDCLTLSAQVGPHAHAVVTTPAAAKWYGAVAERAASQTVALTVTGRLEWLPAETIVFNHAVVSSQIAVQVDPTGSMIGWDLIVFGRQASLEQFVSGRFDQTLQVRLGDELLWTDRISLRGDDPLFESPVGLRGHRSLATVWVVLPSDCLVDEALIDSVREVVPPIAWTALHERLLVGRALADPLTLRTEIERAWSWLRPRLWRLPADRPRLWST